MTLREKFSSVLKAPKAPAERENNVLASLMKVDERYDKFIERLRKEHPELVAQARDFLCTPTWSPPPD